MNLSKQLVLALSAILFSFGTSYAADSVLRVSCEPDGVGAEVSLNGKFRGACPLDIVVKEGSWRLAVVKPMDKSLQHEYRRMVRVGEGVVMKVQIPDSDWRIGYTESLRASVKDFPAKLAAAKSGDKAAMTFVGKAYSHGLGVAEDSQQALAWLSKAAEAGDADAMQTLGEFFYVPSFDFPKDEEKSLEWTRRAALAKPDDKVLQRLLRARTSLLETNKLKREFEASRR